MDKLRGIVSVSAVNTSYIYIYTHIHTYTPTHAHTRTTLKHNHPSLALTLTLVRTIPKPNPYPNPNISKIIPNPNPYPNPNLSKTIPKQNLSGISPKPNRNFIPLSPTHIVGQNGLLQLFWTSRGRQIALKLNHITVKFNLHTHSLPWGLPFLTSCP